MQNLRNLSASERSVGIIGEAISKLVRNTAVLFGGFRAGLEMHDGGQARENTEIALIPYTYL